MLRSLAFASLALLAVPALAAPVIWDVDPAHSQVGFAVKHMMVATVRGHFTKFSGKVTVDGPDWTKATVEATIDATSIDTRNESRDKHLRSDDFFAVQKTPNITFKSTKIEKAGDGYKLYGDLTIRGISKPVVWDVAAPSKEWKNPMGMAVIATSATTKVNRKDWNIEWNKKLDGGGVLVDDMVTLTLDLEMNHK